MSQLETLWYTRCPVPTGLGIAVQKGWLEQTLASQGTRIQSLRESSEQAVRESHFDHSLQNSVRHGGNIPAIWARSENQSAVVVGVTWVDECQGILVRRDSGIRALADLKGKRLGLPLRRRALIDVGRAGAQKAFVTALTLAGLDPRIARWTHIEAPDFEFPQRSGGRDIELAALRSGYVDAVFLRGAQGYAARGEADLRELVDLNRLEDPLLRVNNGTPRPVTVDRAFLARHPDVVRRYLAVLLRAASWARAHPDEVAGLVALENPGYTVDAVAGALGPGLHRSLSPALGPLQLAGLAAQKDFLLDWGYIRHDFDVADWTDPAPLAEALASEQRAPAAALTAGTGALRHGVASHVH